ncbi:MAG: N-acetylmuramoyl-L-alanine amidase [Alphaproteobacteria bacterium]|nr:N-acetylmuramoyl-L-alanine amidase [Alphaproteobacteria bacterium]
MNLTDRPSPNHDERLPEDGGAAAIDMLVIHYTGMVPDARALDWLCDPASSVSAHYFIDEAGVACRLVPENRRAWHAGVSAWRGATDINSRSIGIELSNPGHEFGYRDFPPPQIDALVTLTRDIVARHPIPRRNVVGHSDIAPARKIDPGERFPWRQLAEVGFGLWPNQGTDSTAADDTDDVAAMLAAYGYDTDNNALADVVAAFQRHFRPERFDGVADGETRARLAALLGSVAGGAVIS